MRVEAYTQVQQAYKATYTKKTDAKQDVKKTDKVDISSIGKDITIAKKAVREAPDIRMDVVVALKEKLNNGTYDVSAEEFADKLLTEYDGAL
ncbi:MAG: flagellar biosynthesis anti-sigma factor FlgM [Lachnospiraceae bacterium]|jgi:negative regulator of flagellin synthesis FlgM|nr:flagellar biosynthesis anti-sigma factor FlgM [Lachnospiraceae bacterium]